MQRKVHSINKSNDEYMQLYSGIINLIFTTICKQSLDDGILEIIFMGIAIKPYKFNFMLSLNIVQSYFSRSCQLPKLSHFGQL